MQNLFPQFASHAWEVGDLTLFEALIIIILIIYSIYRALIPNGPKALYIIKNYDKILNLQNSNGWGI